MLKATVDRWAKTSLRNKILLRAPDLLIDLRPIINKHINLLYQQLVYKLSNYHWMKKKTTKSIKFKVPSINPLKIHSLLEQIKEFSFMFTYQVEKRNKAKCDYCYRPQRDGVKFKLRFFKCSSLQPIQLSESFTSNPPCSFYHNSVHNWWKF